MSRELQRKITKIPPEIPAEIIEKTWACDFYTHVSNPKIRVIPILAISRQLPFHHLLPGICLHLFHSHGERHTVGLLRVLQIRISHLLTGLPEQIFLLE
jgi:hypothetical protein